MGKVARWLEVGYRLIGLIVASTLVAATVSSVAAAEAGEDLLTVLTADLLVVSVSIFLAAVAAAWYAKPGFDEVMASRRPSQLEMTYFALHDANENLLVRTDLDDGLSRFELQQPMPSRVKLYLGVANVGKSSSRCILNLRVPFQCDLKPCDPPKVEHTVSSASGRVFELVKGIETRCRGSTADAVLPPSVSRTYSAEIDLPEGGPWDEGWPMRVQFFGPSEPGFAIDRSFWVAHPPESSVAEATPTQLDETLT